MPLSPPASPTTGQTYTANGRTWAWSGAAYAADIALWESLQ
jgi:hypothetical protein